MTRSLDKMMRWWRRLAPARERPPVLVGGIVSRKYRLVWLDVSKTASSTIRHVLLRADPDAEHVNEPTRGLYARHPEARDYYSFAFVRHPFTRALSFHAEMHFAHERGTDASFVGEKETKRRKFFARYPGLAETSDFEDYCRWLHTPYGADTGGNRHFRSQHLQIRLEDGRLPDFIGRFENLDADLRRLAARIGMPPPRLPTLHTMLGHEPRPEALAAARAARDDRLTERSRLLLRARYAEDFELFGYPPA